MTICSASSLRFAQIRYIAVYVQHYGTGTVHENRIRVKSNVNKKLQCFLLFYSIGAACSGTIALYAISMVAYTVLA
jgi:hypothetical protein